MAPTASPHLATAPGSLEAMEKLLETIARKSEAHRRGEGGSRQDLAGADKLEEEEEDVQLGQELGYTPLDERVLSPMWLRGAREATPLDLGAIPMTRENTPIHHSFSELSLQGGLGLGLGLGSLFRGMERPNLGLGGTYPAFGDGIRATTIPAMEENQFRGIPPRAGAEAFVMQGDRGVPHMHLGGMWMQPGFQATMPATMPPPMHVPMQPVVAPMHMAGSMWLGHQDEAFDAEATHLFRGEGAPAQAPAPAVPPPPEPLGGEVAPVQGSTISFGSVGHPESCAAPCKYAFRRGCKDGAGCTRCHLCLWTRESERRAKRATGRVAAPASPHVAQ